MRTSALRLATAAALGLGVLAVCPSASKADDYYPQNQQYRDHVHTTRASMRTRVSTPATAPARAPSVYYDPATAATYYASNPYLGGYVYPRYVPPSRVRVFRPLTWFRR